MGAASLGFCDWAKEPCAGVMDSTAVLGGTLLQLAPKSTACLRVCTQNSDVRHSGHRAPPTRQGDKATASHHERGQARTCGGAGDGHAVEHNLYAGWATMASVFLDRRPTRAFFWTRHLIWTLQSISIRIFIWDKVLNLRYILNLP